MTATKTQKPVFLVREFMGHSSRQHEVHIVGPFDDRKIATVYKNRTKNTPSRNYYEYVPSARITTAPPKECDYRMTPCKYTIEDIEDEIAEKAQSNVQLSSKV